jgi:hypothetical protein
MLSRFITIISLVVFLVLLISGSRVEGAIIKGAIVFFTLIGGYIIIRFLISIIKKTSLQDQE